jgi:hypothetical protein
MLILLLYFAVGFVSEFFIVRYYNALHRQDIFAAMAYNSILMFTNIIFIGMVIDKNYILTGLYVIGQNCGIAAAMKFNRKEE